MTQRRIVDPSIRFVAVVDEIDPPHPFPIGRSDPSLERCERRPVVAVEPIVREAANDRARVDRRHTLTQILVERDDDALYPGAASKL